MKNNTVPSRKGQRDYLDIILKGAKVIKKALWWIIYFVAIMLAVMIAYRDPQPVTAKNQDFRPMCTPTYRLDIKDIGSENTFIRHVNGVTYKCVIDENDPFIEILGIEKSTPKKEEAKEQTTEVKEEKVVEKKETTNNETTSTKQASKEELQNYAYNLVINTYGWSEHDFDCLVKLWNRESGWNPNAYNKSSGAHGIPQSLPASKMASEGSDYYTNGYTQIRWGLKYIKNRYGNPSNAWSHSQSKGWY